MNEKLDETKSEVPLPNREELGEGEFAREHRPSSNLSPQGRWTLKVVLLVLFSTILFGMLAATIRASLDRSILEVGSQLTSDLWFQATLVDAYFGFLTFYVWVAYKEVSNLGRVVWLVAIMLLGNIAMSIYMLRQLWRWDTSQGAAGLLLRNA